MNKINVITIDGPSASGKGSLAREIAKTYDLSILDSGSLYRLYAYYAKEGIKNELISNTIQENIKFKISNHDLVIMNVDNDITDDLRSESIAALASELSSKEEVRDALFNIQRSFYNEKGLVADGRDMGTVVFKEAKLKIYLTASAEVRAKRRYLELQNRGQEVNMPALIADIEQRDLKDSSRELSPLLPADDAHIIDSSEMSLEDVISFTKSLVKEEYL
ncbi:MAG: (d)CMP kinase [Gammaproteobacteria bacterium]|nr:MAG: cytidylate kinase [Rhodobacteraceae bacterium TMED111]|tara:strand:+ start:7298 stop:7957 length:660 start_codon:yes stop_codon:yes gene_type:complete